MCRIRLLCEDHSMNFFEELPKKLHHISRGSEPQTPRTCLNANRSRAYPLKDCARFEEMGDFPSSRNKFVVPRVAETGTGRSSKMDGS
jgi:hypothetical protein